MALPGRCGQRRLTVGLSAEADQVQAATHRAFFHSTHLHGRRGRESGVVTPTLTRRIRPHLGRGPHSFPARSYRGLPFGRPHNGRPTPFFACLSRHGSEPHRSGDDPITDRKSSKRPLLGLGETCLSVLALCVSLLFGPPGLLCGCSFFLCPGVFCCFVSWSVASACPSVPSWRSGVLSVSSRAPTQGLAVQVPFHCVSFFFCRHPNIYGRVLQVAVVWPWYGSSTLSAA